MNSVKVAYWWNGMDSIIWKLYFGRVDKIVMVHIYNKLLLGHKKEWDVTICNSIDGPRRYYAKWNKSVRERQIPHGFNYM